MALWFDGNFTVWNVKDTDSVVQEKIVNGSKMAVVNASSSSRRGDKYVRDWHGKLLFNGERYDKLIALGLKDCDRIHVTKGKHTVKFANNNSTFYNYEVYEFELLDRYNEDGGAAKRTTAKVTVDEKKTVTEDDFPF